jgi:hypothetical protein
VNAEAPNTGSVAPAASADPMPQPPEPLPDDACCGNGCDPCVFDFFHAEQEAHRAALRAWRARQAAIAQGRDAAG